jgi:hypothetical protein
MPRTAGNIHGAHARGDGGIERRGHFHIGRTPAVAIGGKDGLRGSGVWVCGCVGGGDRALEQARSTSNIHLQPVPGIHPFP